MSWFDDINTEIEITTGDGSVYNPLYYIKPKTVDFNISEFNFIGVAGTLVKRTESRGTRYDLEIIFQGENNFDDSKAFELSAKDKRPWQIIHPVYGEITCQPLSLTFDPTGLNTTVVTGTVVETLTDEYPRLKNDPAGQIALMGINADEGIYEIAAGNIKEPKPSDAVSLTNDIESVYAEGAGVIESGEESNEYFNRYQQALSAADNFLSNVSTGLSKAQSMINYPFQISASAQDRLNMLKTQFDTLSTSIETIIDPNKKNIYTSNSASVLTAICQAVSTPQDGDYESAMDVLNVLDTLSDLQEQWNANMDTLQTGGAGEIDSFIPPHDTVVSVNDILNETSSNLLDIALDSKQERFIYLDAPSNVIMLSHRFYGLKSDDSTIDYLIKTNGFGLNSFLQVDKGTKVLYYV